MNFTYGSKIYRMVLLLTLAMPFYAAAEVNPPVKRPVAAILEDFAAKRKVIEALIKTHGALEKSTVATMLHKDRYEESYTLPDGKGGEYEYVFRGKDLLLYSIYFRNSGGPGFGAEFNKQGLIRFFPTVKNIKQITGYMMAWWPDTLAPWYYYEFNEDSPKNFFPTSYREIRWDRAGKVTCDTYSEAGDIGFGAERHEYQPIHPPVEPTPTPDPKKAEREKLIKDTMATVYARTPREAKLAKLQGVIAAFPGDPDNFFIEFEIACCYLIRYDFPNGERMDEAKGIEVILHCIEAYPQHANNRKMLTLHNYLAQALAHKKDYDGAKKYCLKVIEKNPDTIVFYNPATPTESYSKEISEQDKMEGLTTESPQYQDRVKAREKCIDSLRQTAIETLAHVEKSSGGLVALKALHDERKKDALYQSTIQKELDYTTRQLDHATKQLEKRMKENPIPLVK